ncbi:hypothetical protein Q6V61_000452 [Neisseria gonorrhoeae]
MPSEHAAYADLTASSAKRLPCAKAILFSSAVRTGAAVGNIFNLTASQTADTLGTVRNTASQPSTLSMPRVIRRAGLRVLPFWE